MFVSLNAGKYILVCSCGGRNEVMTLFSYRTKISPHCWYCKGNGKFARVMENKDLKFSYNWNGKLNCQCFTTLRLNQPMKYYKGAVFNVFLNNQPKGRAKVLEVNCFTIDQINEFVARVDTGLSAKECQRMIREMYKNSPQINWNTQNLAFCLLEYENKNNQASLSF